MNEQLYADTLVKMMAQEIGTYQSPLVRSIAIRCALVAVNQIIKSDTQCYYGDYYKKVKSILLN